MKNQQPQWLKIVYIIVFLAIAGYTYWQQFQQQQAEGENRPVVVTEGDDDTMTLKNSPLGDRVQKVNEKTSTKPAAEKVKSDKAVTQADSKSTNPNRNSTEKKNPAAEFGVTSFGWSKVQQDNFTSPQGLVYTMGPNREHRLEHVFRHAEDQPNRPGRHGVFDGTHDEILQTLDDAYKLVKFRSSDVQTETDGNRKVHLINMKKKIGYIGGQTGNRQDHPAAKKIRMVLEGSKIVTAFPLWLILKW